MLERCSDFWFLKDEVKGDDKQFAVIVGPMQWNWKDDYSKKSCEQLFQRNNFTSYVSSIEEPNTLTVSLAQELDMKLLKH